MVCVPPPKEKVGGRSQGPCAALLATIAAIAPAAPAFATFMLTAQRPRSISRIFPRNGVPVHGLAPAALVQPRLVLALVVSYTSWPETRVGVVDQDCQIAPTGASVGVWTWYIFAMGWNVAATLMTSGVVEGEPTM